MDCPPPTRPLWRVNYETKVSSAQHDEGEGFMHLFVEVQIPTAEGDYGDDIVDAVIAR